MIIELPGAQKRRVRTASLSVGLCALLAACSSPTDASTAHGGALPPAISAPVGELAFPGAAGHGAASKGGRGGRVIAVESLADHVPGSLRSCIEQSGPRVCVFRVSGIIRFIGRPPVIRNPYLTIAGQTAPGGGIIVTHDGLDKSRSPLLIKNTHDVVVRHIRVRLDRLGQNRKADDAFTIEGSHHVILDHVSGSWARDELVNGYADNDQITISNSIFAFGIPRHDKCALLASDPVDAQHLSFIGNICAHNGDRNPDLNFPPGSCVEVVNNVFYNAQSQFAEIWESFGGAPVSIVGNVFKAGPNTPRRAIGIARNVLGSKGTAQIYLWDNDFRGNFIHISDEARQVIRANSPCPLTRAPLLAEAAYDVVLAQAGALPRDAVDAQVVDDIRTGSGRIVRVPGRMPMLVTGTPYADRDADGMADDWEREHSSDPASFDPWDDSDGDGVRNLDAFLAWRADRLVQQP